MQTAAELVASSVDVVAAAVGCMIAEWVVAADLKPD